MKSATHGPSSFAIAGGLAVIATHDPLGLDAARLQLA